MRAALALIGIALLAGCGAGAPNHATRVVGGERRHEAFVSPFAYEWYIRGELALARDDLQAAAEAFRQARTGPKDDTLVIARLALVLERLGQHERADGLVREGLELDPRSEAVWLARGEIAERRSRPQRAIASYERAWEVAPGSDEAPLALARMLHNRGHLARAHGVLREYVTRARGGTAAAQRARLELALLRGDAEAAAAAAAALVRIAPGRRDDVRRAVELALEQGRALLAAEPLDHLPRGGFDPAKRVRALLAAGRESAAEGVLATAPAEAFGGLVGQAELYLHAGRPDRAQELAEAAAAVGDSPRAWLVAGRAALEQDRLADAAAHLTRVPAGVRGFAEARAALADALSAGGLAALGAEVLGQSLQQSPDPSPRLRRALAQVRMRRADLDGAIAALGESEEVADRLVRARLLERAGRLEQAHRTFARLAAHGGELEPVSRARARAEHHVRQGHLRDAIAALRKATRRAPERLWLRARLAELMARAGDEREAKELLAGTKRLATDAALHRRLDQLAGE